jgi:cytochrome P450
MFHRLREFCINLQYLNIARKNIVAAWPKHFYRKEFIQLKVFTKHIFILNRPEDVQRVMVSNASNYRKSLANRQSLKPILGQGLFVSEGKLWERHRKLMSPATHRSRLAGYSKTMVEAALETAKSWNEKGDGVELDLAEEMTLLTSEIITRTMFGEELGERNFELYRAFQDYLASHGRAHISEMIGLPSWLPRPGQRKGHNAVRRFHGVIDSVIRQRMESKIEHDDLLQMLLDFHDEQGEPMTDDLLRDEVASFYLAGHETTAITLTWAFWLLEKHPEVKQRLIGEIDSVLGLRIPKFEDVPKLVYARAVLDETLRMYPPVHVFSRQALADDEISGHFIPKGSFMTISSWVLHRHEMHWDQPEVFDPDRFLAGSGRKVKPFAYIPFGAGPRICLGKHFGLTELVLLFSFFTQKFDFSLRPGHRVQPLGRMTLRPSDGMPMMIKARAPVPVV